jgi:DNA modification methylase
VASPQEPAPGSALAGAKSATVADLPAHWPKQAIERWPIDRLVPYARNARTHSDAQIAQIAASIREWGWTNPVLVDGAGGIIAGHGRVAAARKLEIAEVPVIVADGWTEAQKRAYVLADNQLALNAGWDAELLRLEVADLRDMGADLALIGFGEGELAEMFAGKTEGLTDPDAVPETPGTPVSALSDVWLLGRHRIVCGDCTDASVVAKALNGVTPHLMVTDPPYGVEYDPKWRANAGINRNTKKLGVVENDHRADWREAWAQFPGDVAYIWHAGVHAATVAESLIACGFDVRSQIIWAKDRFALSRGHYHWQHEPCWYAVRKGGAGHWLGDRKQSTLWQIPARDDSGLGHGTQKPVECMKRPIENNSSPGQAVYEPFSGSGTTIIAAEIAGRCCHEVELNPAYVDVAVTRWQDFTGGAAVLEATGETFTAVAAKRGGGRSELRHQSA